VPAGFECRRIEAAKFLTPGFALFFQIEWSRPATKPGLNSG